MSRGYIFTLDAFLAIGIIIVGMIIIYTYNPFSPPTDQPQTYVHNTLGIYASTKIQDLNDPYINGLISNGWIKNRKNTIIEQIGEFYYKRNSSINATMRNLLTHLTTTFVQEGYGVAFYVDGSRIFIKNSTKAKASVLISTKTPVLGILNASSVWGPYIVEVRVWQ